jgi:hypothetical protein
MQVITALLGEHGLLYAQCDELERRLPTLTALPRLRYQVAHLGAAILRHACFENGFLFTALNPHWAEVNPLGLMRNEHDGIEQALVAFPQIQDLHKAHAGAQFMLEVARQHCSREEQMVYPVAQALLSRKELLRLGEQWAARQIFL